MPLRDKLELRRHYRTVRKNMSAEVKAQCDDAISNSFLNCKAYKDCETLLAFVSTDVEVNTKTIISTALLDGKRVAVPKCRAEKGKMDFYLIRSYDDLEKGYYGILEPKINECELLRDFSNSLCLIPGLAFDKDGYRLGFGGGYYDRFLENYTGIAVGICYSNCIGDKLPVSEHDIPIRLLITD